MHKNFPKGARVKHVTDNRYGEITDSNDFGFGIIVEVTWDGGMKSSLWADSIEIVEDKWKSEEFKGEISPAIKRWLSTLPPKDSYS